MLFYREIRFMPSIKLLSIREGGVYSARIYVENECYSTRWKIGETWFHSITVSLIIS